MTELTEKMKALLLMLLNPPLSVVLTSAISLPANSAAVGAAVGAAPEDPRGGVALDNLRAAEDGAVVALADNEGRVATPPQAIDRFARVAVLHAQGAARSAVLEAEARQVHRLLRVQAARHLSGVAIAGWAGTILGG